MTYSSDDSCWLRQAYVPAAAADGICDRATAPQYSVSFANTFPQLCHALITSLGFLNAEGAKSKCASCVYRQRVLSICKAKCPRITAPN